MASRVSNCFFVFFVLVSSISLLVRADDVVEAEHVLTLDHSNFTEIVSKHDFIVVEFYAPWCGHCKQLAPEYEKAASVLKSHDPPLTLAKYDASDEANREIATQYKIQGFPTIKILRNGGEIVQDYKGPREADGIVSYIKKQVGPATVELKSVDDVTRNIDEKSISIVGIFPKFSGAEFENFTKVAEKLRADYGFAHTLDAKLLPKGSSAVFKPTVRVLKPFDALFADSKDFDVEALEKFIEGNSVPLVTIFDKDPSNQPYLADFFSSPHTKVLLILDFAGEDIEAFRSVYKDVASALKEDGLSFLLGDLEASSKVVEYFGLDGNQAPVIFVQNKDGKKYVKVNLEADDIVPFFKDYLDGNLKPHVKSEPIPTVNDEPVKVVVHDSIDDFVLKSPKNVLLEFYAPWCGHCKKLAPILDEVAESFAADPNVVIAKLDATKNDFPTDIFNVQGFPTLYFKTASGKILDYDGDRQKEDFIEFIKKNRDDVAADSAAAESSVESDIKKDEL